MLLHKFWLKVPLSVRQSTSRNKKSRMRCVYLSSCSLSRIEARKRNSISEAVDLLKCYLPFLLSNSSTANFSQYSCEDYLCPHNKKVFSVENWRHSYFWYDLRLYIWAWLGSNQRPSNFLAISGVSVFIQRLKPHSKFNNASNASWDKFSTPDR